MSSDNKLDETTLNKLKINIFIQEKNNAKTKKNTDTEMVEHIRRIIQTEVDRNDN